MRHFTLNGLFDVFWTSKGEKIAFPPPSRPCNVVPLFELPLENKKHPNFEWKGQGRGVDSHVSEVTLFEYNDPKILSPIVDWNFQRNYGGLLNNKLSRRKRAHVSFVLIEKCI